MDLSDKDLELIMQLCDTEGDVLNILVKRVPQLSTSIRQLKSHVSTLAVMIETELNSRKTKELVKNNIENKKDN